MCTQYLYDLREEREKERTAHEILCLDGRQKIVFQSNELYIRKSRDRNQ